MQSTLVILRGNSASGKTTIAKRLQQHYGQGTLVVPQDTVRRNMLMVSDKENNLSIELMQQIAQYGKGKCPVVIVEGILNSKRYGDMLKALISYFDGRAHAYYFDLSFEETVKRHQTRPRKEKFGEDSLRDWWNPHDQLGVVGEVTFTDELSADAIFTYIVTALDSPQS